MRISDWSSDVCSSDLEDCPEGEVLEGSFTFEDGRIFQAFALGGNVLVLAGAATAVVLTLLARKSVVSGKSVSVRVDLGGRRIIKKKNNRRNGKRYHDTRCNSESAASADNTTDP